MAVTGIGGGAESTGLVRCSIAAGVAGLRRRWQRCDRHQGHGPGERDFYRRGAGEAAGAHGDRHTRYSTTGDSALLNAQPISWSRPRTDCDCAQREPGQPGQLAHAAGARRRRFQTTSDTEIIVQLIAHSRCNTLWTALPTRSPTSMVRSRFDVTRNRIFAARDPHGSGRYDGADCRSERRAGYVCVRQRDLRVRPAACEVRARRGAGELVMVRRTA